MDTYNRVSKVGSERVLFWFFLPLSYHNASSHAILICLAVGCGTQASQACQCTSTACRGKRQPPGKAAGPAGELIPICFTFIIASAMSPPSFLPQDLGLQTHYKRQGRLLKFTDVTYRLW